MRAMFLHQSVEYRLEIPGDSWVQGDQVSGTLSVKNRGASVVQLEEITFAIACGQLKKVAKKEPDAFSDLQQIPLSNAATGLSTDCESISEWSLQLSNNCVVSDKTQTLYLLVFKGSEQQPIGSLPLSVTPHPFVKEFYDLFESSFSFVLKSVKSKKGGVEAKLTPPSSRKFPTLEYLLLLSSFEEDQLRLRYSFRVKKMEATATTLGIKRGENKVEQQLALEKIAQSGAYVDHRLIEHAIETALDPVTSRL